MPREKDITKIELIRNSALRIVLKTGFYQLKMADVAKDAKIATGTLYIYYKSKEELINDVYLETKNEIANVILNKSNQNETYFLTYKSMWKAYFNFCIKNPEKMLFVEQFIYSGLISDNVYKKSEAKFNDLNQFIIQGQKIGVLKDTSIEIIKAQIQGAVHEIVKWSLKESKNIKAKDLDTCFQMSWDSVKI